MTLWRQMSRGIATVDHGLHPRRREDFYFEVRVDGMHQNRPARFDGVFALSAGSLSGVVVGAMSSSLWEWISTGSAIAAAFVLARLLIRSLPWPSLTAGA